MQAPMHKPSIYLGMWNIYFLAKLFLYGQGLIDLHIVENLAFVACLLLPLSNKWRTCRNWVALPVAVCLLYYDSWLPTLSRALSEARLVSHFSATYLLELSGRLINWQVIAGLILLTATYLILARYLRFAPIIVLTLLGIGMHQLSSTSLSNSTPQTISKTSAPSSLDEQVRDFYQQQAQQHIELPPPSDNAAPFDIIFIHICSLSWDDLSATGLDSHPLWKNVDFLFQHFNSAAAYSGPAAIRLNRATCGQADHKGLYNQAASSCYLFQNLAQAGFRTQTILNHDGHFDDFLKLIQQQGLPPPNLKLENIPAPLRSFDDTKIYADSVVLSQWLTQRNQSNFNRVATYYNSISLHDGNIVTKQPNLGSLDTYKMRATQLLDDLNHFIQQLQNTNRNTVLIIIPEHGAAIRGEKIQFAGLRELATPPITLVPVGIKVIGSKTQRNGESVVITQPSSYLAISQILKQMLIDSPFNGNTFTPQNYLQNLPVTPFVSENEKSIVIQSNQQFFFRQDRQNWQTYQR